MSRSQSASVDTTFLEEKKLTLEKVNKMSYTDFIQVFGSVIEHTPLAAASVWSSSPFSDLPSLHRAFITFISNLNESSKSGLLRCHPDLAGKLAQSGQLSTESLKEQRTAGLLDLSDQERKNLTEMNDKYKQKFSFPFVVCARENKKQAILTGIRHRLDNGVLDEVECGAREISKIAWYRLMDLIHDPNNEHHSKI